MIRLTLATVLVTCASVAAAAAAPPPSSSSQPSPPASQPTTLRRAPADDLHRQAIDAMRKGELDAASALMEKAYGATPAAQRTRPLVLNRAILDLRQRVHVMRAVRDVYDYLRAHPEPDEPAQDILGAALNIAAADTPRWRKAPLWQSALREWERRDEQMTAARPGFRRWGPHWLDERQYEALEGDRARLERAIEEQSDRAARAATRIEALRHRHVARAANNALARTQAEAEWAERVAVQQQRLKQQQQQPRPPGSPSSQDPQAPPPTAPQPPPKPPSAPPPSRPPQAPNGNTPARPDVPPGTFVDVTGRAPGSTTADARDAAELVAALRDLQSERDHLAELQRALAAVRPAWPVTFDPIDPAALAPPPPRPPDPDAMAALIAEAAAVAERTRTPFGASGTNNAPRPRAPQPAPNATSAPTATPAPPLPESPFGPRNIDRRESR